MQKSHKPEAVSHETENAEAGSQRDQTAIHHSPTGTTEDFAKPVFAPPTAEGEIGRLGKYHIQTELGRGGMGAVYLAFDERLQRKIALKVMLPKAAANPTAKDRFLREARAAAQISSDYVVNIHEADEIDGVPYIALQFLQGYPLDEFLKKKGNPTILQCLRIAHETALGLAAAHELGLVHRDIKPGNIWLEAPNGRVKVLDFGLAKPIYGNEIHENEGAELTAIGAVVGTPSYMAPEQGMGQPVDGRADLFSLGCVLYRLVTGKLPFVGSTIVAILTALATEEPTPVSELNPEVPESLAKLIRRLMAKKPENRPASAKEVANELARIATAPKPTPTPETPNVPPAAIVYVPMAITLAPNPFMDIDITESNESSEDATELVTPPQKPRKFPTKLVGGLFAGLLVIIVGGIIIKITNKDGTVTEIKAPDDAKIEVIDKTTKTSPVKPATAAANAERMAAEYALLLGGTVRVNDQEIDVKDIDRLPKTTFRLTSIDLAFTKVSDLGLAQFKECKNLTGLTLAFTNTTNAGLAHFKDCKSLKLLNLDGLKVTTEGLAHFKDCKGLVKLSLTNTQVTDAGLAHFKECKNLTNLVLYNTQVSDTGVEHLKDKKSLIQLDLRKTKVTATRIDELNEALPKCKIEWDGDTTESK